jgi:Acyl-CoA dehydrogenase, N-terminal domain
MVSHSLRQELPVDSTPAFFDCAKLLACEFAARAAQHDRDASFPFENFDQLSEAGLLALTVPAALGAKGAGALDAARIIGIIDDTDNESAVALRFNKEFFNRIDAKRSLRTRPFALGARDPAM